MDLTDIFRRFARNASLILGSRLLFGLMNLASNALVVRAFGLADLGVVLLLQSYARLFTDIVKFDSWQAVLSFGAKFQHDGDERGLRRLLGFTLGVDLASIVVGIAFAILFVPYAADIFEWPAEVSAFAPVFVVAVLFMVHSTPNGILRLYDRVDVIAWQFALNAIIRFLGVAAVAFFGGDVLHLAIVWFTGWVVSGSLPMVVAFRELAKRGLIPDFHVNWFRAGNEFHRIWRFLAFSNASSSLSFIYFSGAVMVVGASLGGAAAATLQIAQQFAIALSRPLRTLGPLISPEFAKLAASGDWRTFRTLILHQLALSAAVIGVLGAILFACLGTVLEIVYGPEILGAIWLFRLLLLATMLTMITFSFEPALLSANKPTLLIALRASAAGVYAAVGFAFLREFGILSLGIAFLCSQTAYVASFVWFGARMLRKRMARAESSATGAPEREDAFAFEPRG